MNLTLGQKKQITLVILAVALLMSFSVISNLMESREQIQNGILRGSTEEEIYQETFVVRTEDGTSQDVNITVYPRQLTEAEGQELLDRAVQEFETSYLGENHSADFVCSDLVFPSSFCQGMVSAVYDSDFPELVWEDGTVSTQGLSEEGQLVTIKVAFSCQNWQLEYVCYLQIMPPALTQEQQLEEWVLSSVEQKELDSRDSPRFVLPMEINGTPVEWRKKIDTQPLVFVFLGIVAIVCIIQKSKQDEHKRKLTREKIFQREYPQMVTQLSLLMGAGMTLTTAWERMVKRYLEEQMREADKQRSQRLYMEEMLITYREIRDGKSIKKAYESFGNRIGTASYRKLSALLLQNLDKGTKDIIYMLDTEAQAAIEEQKRSVRRQGEEAGTKLLFPMFLLFLLVLIVIMVPAMQSF